MQHSITTLLPEASFGLRLLSLPACVWLSVCVSVCVCFRQPRTFPRHNSSPVQARNTKNWTKDVKQLGWGPYCFVGAIDIDLQCQIQLRSPNWPLLELVRTITHQPFKLGSPNLNQRCKAPWLRSLLFMGQLTLTFKIKSKFEGQNFIKPSCRKYITTTGTGEPSLPRLLHGPDCFMVSILYTYLYT